MEATGSCWSVGLCSGSLLNLALHLLVLVLRVGSFTQGASIASDISRWFRVAKGAGTTHHNNLTDRYHVWLRSLDSGGP